MIDVSELYAKKIAGTLSTDDVNLLFSAIAERDSIAAGVVVCKRCTAAEDQLRIALDRITHMQSWAKEKQVELKDFRNQARTIVNMGAPVHLTKIVNSFFEMVDVFVDKIKNM